MMDEGSSKYFNGVSAKTFNAGEYKKDRKSNMHRMADDD
jgi:hypothetical protein